MLILMKFKIKRQLLLTHLKSHTQAQPPNGVACCSLNSRAKTPVAFRNIKCATPMTFSQKLYQSHTFEVTEEFEPLMDANSLESLKNLLESCLK